MCEAYNIKALADLLAGDGNEDSNTSENEECKPTPVMVRRGEGPDKCGEDPRPEIPQTESGKLSSATGKGGKEIWTTCEVESQAENVSADPRKAPEYEIHYRQSVTTEDIFLQLGRKNQGSASCENLVLEILLPGEDFNQIRLDVQFDSVELRSPLFRLSLPLPHTVDPKAGHAKWNSEKQQLSVILVLCRELDSLNF